MACYVGARIARSGRASVTLTGTWAEALLTLSASGVRVEDAGGTWSIRVAAVPLAEVPVADVALVLVKSTRTTTVACHVARSVGANGVAVTLQNGLGNLEALGVSVAAPRLLAGVTTAGATLLGPGRVRGFVAPTAIGQDAAGYAARVAELFSASGLPTSVHDDIDAIVWRKLAVNCAINPLSALLGVANGALLERAEDRQVLETAAEEVQAVAEARGTTVDLDYREAALEAARLTSHNRSSMLQDFDRRVPTEIEALTGAVVREGARLGVPTSTNSRLLDEVRAREAAYRVSASFPA